MSRDPCVFLVELLDSAAAVAHAYFHVDPDLLWDIAAVRIPADLPLLCEATAGARR